VQAQTQMFVMAFHCQDWVEQTTGYTVPNEFRLNVPESGSPETAKSQTTETTTSAGSNDEEDTGEEDLEKGLLELVICAARTKHEQNGVKFDESYEIDVTADVSFVVVSASLPLGGKLLLPIEFDRTMRFVFFVTHVHCFI